MARVLTILALAACVASCAYMAATETAGKAINDRTALLDSI